MEFNKQTVCELADLIQKKEAGVYEITQSFLNITNTIDNELECFISVLPDQSLKRAEIVQEQINNGNINSLLAGIPFALKDNICTKDILTTCGSKMLYNFVPPYNSYVAQKLDDAGGILTGKLNLDEFAMGGSTENSYYITTKNPWDPQRVPGGSSGGSAAAVSSRQVPFALGSDTGGSIRQPASFCGVVGLKPTYGALSRYGLVAFASSLDQIGPITRNVKDCAAVMNVVAGYDSMDSTSADVEHPDYLSFIGKDIKGMKIGVPKEYFADGVNGEVKESVKKALAKIEELGAVCEEFSLPITEYAIPAYYLISSAEASSNLARYDGIKYGFRAEGCTDLIDLYTKTRSLGFGSEVKRRIMLGTYALSSGYYDAYYKKALKVRTLIMDEFDKAFSKYDLIAGPTAPTTAYKIGEKTDNPLEMYLGDIFTVSVNIAGLPAISVPCGLDSKNLPVGLQLIGKPFSEGIIMQAAYAYEQSSGFSKMNPPILDK